MRASGDEQEATCRSVDRDQVGGVRHRLPDVLEGAGEPVWSRWAPRRRRRAAVAASVTAAVAVTALAVGPVQGWWQERSLADQVAVQAEMGIDASSSAWSPSGRGRVDYFVVVANRSPRPVRVTAVDFADERVRLRSRGAGARAVPAGEVAYLPVSVRLDCRAPQPRGRSLRGTVAVVALSGRSVEVPAVLQRADPLTVVVRTLCRLNPGLGVEELSGPVVPLAGTPQAGRRASGSPPAATAQALCAARGEDGCEAAHTVVRRGPLTRE